MDWFLEGMKKEGPAFSLNAGDIMDPRWWSDPEQFATIFDMPRNGPAHKKGLAYSFTKENLAVISVDTFEDTGDHLSMTVSGKQTTKANGHFTRDE